MDRYLYAKWINFFKNKVLGYINEQLCSHLDGKIKKNCEYMVETNGKELISNIQQGTVRRK